MIVTFDVPPGWTILPRFSLPFPSISRPCSEPDEDGFFILTVIFPAGALSLLLLNLRSPAGSALSDRVAFAAWAGSPLPAEATLAPVTASAPATAAPTSPLPACPRVIAPPIGSLRRYAHAPDPVRSVRCGDAPRGRR